MSTVHIERRGDFRFVTVDGELRFFGPIDEVDPIELLEIEELAQHDSWSLHEAGYAEACNEDLAFLTESDEAACRGLWLERRDPFDNKWNDGAKAVLFYELREEYYESSFGALADFALKRLKKQFGEDWECGANEHYYYSVTNCYDDCDDCFVGYVVLWEGELPECAPLPHIRCGCREFAVDGFDLAPSLLNP